MTGQKDHAALLARIAPVLFEQFDICHECAQWGYHTDGDPPTRVTCWASNDVAERWIAALSTGQPERDHAALRETQIALRLLLRYFGGSDQNYRWSEWSSRIFHDPEEVVTLARVEAALRALEVNNG